MGAGEDYKFKFNGWLKTLSQDEKRQYQQLFAEPATWRGYWDQRLGEDESALFTYNDFILDLWEREPRYDLKWLKKRLDEKFIATTLDQISKYRSIFHRLEDGRWRGL